MAIRIVRNESGNCINFVGSTQPAYWNACLSAQINSEDATKVDIINDIRSANAAEIAYEWYAVSFEDFADRDGVIFADAQSMVDYVNENAHVVGIGSVGDDLTDVNVDFRLDDTHTSIIMDNGYSYGVNTIKAVADADGTIHIHAIGEGVPSGDGEPHDKKLFRSLAHTNVSIDSNPVPGGLSDVVNVLNEKFTVGPFESVVIADPHSTMVADVAGTDAAYTLVGSGVVDPAGADLAGNTGTHNNNAGVLTDDTIDAAGEYFSFDIRGEGQIGFGLVLANDDWENYDLGSAAYADPAGFCNGVNSAHYGYQFSHFFHPTPNGPWTNYGANTSYVAGPGWSNATYRFSSSPEGADWVAGNSVKMRCGLDANAYISIDYWDASESNWVTCSRTAYPVPEGAAYKLGIKFSNPAARLSSAPKVHLLEEDDTPTVIGDTGISLLGDATGTLAAGIITSGGVGDNDGFISTEALTQSGEYFEVTLNNDESHTLGLVDEDTNSVATIQADVGDLHGYYHFGARIGTAEQVGATTHNSSGLGEVEGSRPTGCLRYRVGFDTQGRLTVWSSTDGINFVASYNLSSASPTGDYRLMWLGRSAGATCEAVTKGQLSAVPTMHFRFIESPDGYYSFPLFATQEEADYYEEQVAGADNGSSIQLFDDDPSFTQWYMPATSNQQNYGLTPVEDGVTTFLGNPIIWTEITSLTNADLAPPAYADQTVSVNELQSVNIQTQPQDTAYTTTFSGLPAGLLSLDGSVIGTAPEVTGDNVANPSDDYAVTVTRTNNYGSSTGTLTISVQNLTAPVVSTGNWSGVDIVGGTLTADGTATLGVTLSEGERLIIPKAWVDAHINPNGLTLTGQTYLGVLASGADVTEVDQSDFDGLIKWSANSISNYHGAGLTDNLGTTGNITWSNSGATIYDFGIEYSDGQLHLIACNVNSINTEPSVGDGGSFTNVLTVGALTAPITVTLGTNEGATVDLTNADDLDKITIPAAPTTNLTSWTKAIDFSGSSERMQIVDSSYNRVAMKMGGINNQVAAPGASTHTSSDANARPWATAIVFKVDGHSSNQHIWNVGEGTGTTDDNIYLRLSSNRYLYFGWGRSGDSAEMFVQDIGGSISGWHGVYIAHNGTRLGSGGTTVTMAACFDVRYTRGNLSWAVGSNLSTSANWTGACRMNRSYEGDFTIGGRGANRSFHGKVASMVSTTLRRNVPMPSDAEIAEMITDPMGWLNDYKVGNGFRLPWQGSDAGWNFSINDGSSAYSTQVYLMGDGSMDSYSNMIRNQVHPADQNYTKMNMISMVSNDIQNVTISGLS